MSIHSCKSWSPWNKKIFQESTTGQHRLHEEVKSMLMRCRWPARGFIKSPFQPAPLETSSALPKSLHSICASLEEEIKCPETWSVAGLVVLYYLLSLSHEPCCAHSRVSMRELCPHIDVIHINIPDYEIKNWKLGMHSLSPALLWQ